MIILPEDISGLGGTSHKSIVSKISGWLAFIVFIILILTILYEIFYWM